MKASAVAHPIQGLIKYHGLRDPVRRIPFHGSISVCTGPTHTLTTLQVLDEGASSAVVDGKALSGRAMERVRIVVDAVREQANDDRPFRMESRNDFPQYVGLGSSSSGFAALALAAAGAYGWDAKLSRLSEVARLGAGSACRAVTGGISEWVLDGERAYSRQLADEGALDWRIVVPLVAHEEPTEGMHEEVTTSPLFKGRVAYVPEVLQEMRDAVAARELAKIGLLAERDTLNLHAVTMTGQAGHLTWQPATVAAMRAVWAMRAEGVPVWFSIDTGATPYLNTDAAHEKEVAASVRDIDGVSDVIHLQPAGPAHVVEDHLF